MRVEDLDVRELLDLGAKDGLVRFASQRALIFDAVALGLLRKELIETIGAPAARGVLTRFGFAHGWRTAENLQHEFPWDSPRDWQRAGGRLHRLQGIVLFEPVVRPAGEPAPFAEAIWNQSYEAEQHLLHLGQASEPVCWTLVGFASGYLSYCHQQPIYCVETQCRGRGDATCMMAGNPREDWGAELDAHLPFYEQDCLSEALSKLTAELARTESALQKRRSQLGHLGASTDELELAGMVVRSRPMLEVVSLARRAAQVDVTVLVTGESGAGKERVARLIHERSPRAAHPFLAINCGAITEHLLESELFGHVRGAFTGAAFDRVGLFEAASGGTLFLDEIGELTQAMQVKLLRVLAEREVRRVGDTRSRPVNVRIVAATNRDLSAEVAAGRFREDLYYRLRVLELRLPPLRERRDDVMPLARVFLMDGAARMSKQVNGFTPAAADQLLRYAWPGNVRELHNAIERALVICDGPQIDVADLPEEVRAARPIIRAAEPGRPMADVEREHILATLAANRGNRLRTAEQLGIGRATLHRKLRQYKAEGWNEAADES